MAQVPQNSPQAVVHLCDVIDFGNVRFVSKSSNHAAFKVPYDEMQVQ